MSKLIMQSTGKFLVPANGAASKELEKFATSTDLMATVTKPRYQRFHRWYWQTCTLVAEALNDGPSTRRWDQDAVHEALKVGTAHAYLITLPAPMRQFWGVSHAVKTKSTSYAAMDDTQFDAFAEQCLQYLLQEFGPMIADHPNWREVQSIIFDNHTGVMQ